MNAFVHTIETTQTTQTTEPVVCATDFKDDRQVDMSLLVRGYEVVIGFETHSQLSTQSKIFSRASTAFGAEPNTQACAVDLALPGTLPVMNKGAVERAIQFGLAVGAHIAPRSIFARKNYFYPDLPKGYQISQFEIPVVQGGSVEFFLGDVKKSVRLVRAHLEEDAGKSTHGAGLYQLANLPASDASDVSNAGAQAYVPLRSEFDLFKMSGIDLNRAGTPLLEIVTEPDMRSSAEAVAYAKELHKIVTWIGICDGNMQEGSFRCDANVSVRKPGAKFGTRREIKNLNSFKFMQQAIDYEVSWQIAQIEDGHAIEQATVLFNPDTGETRAMRTKEDAADYRYFPDPDLPPLVIDRAWVERTRSAMPELPRVMAARLRQEHGISVDDAAGLTHNRSDAKYFEDLASILASDHPSKLEIGTLAASWLRGEFANIANNSGLTFSTFGLPAHWLATLLRRVLDSTISRTAARSVFAGMTLVSAKRRNNEQAQEFSVDGFIETAGLKQMNDTGALEAIIDEVLAANAKNVAEFKAGNEKALNALVGMAMKASKGKANPAHVNAVLKAKLA